MLSLHLAVEKLDTADAFVGREAALSELKNHTRSAGAVTIVGAPGIGKTRLAKRFAEQYASSVFVNLEHCTTVSDLVFAVAQAVLPGLSQATPLSAGRAQIRKALQAGSASVLVLDNCEQLHEDCHAVLREWVNLERTPTSRLITSRKALELGCPTVSLEGLSTKVQAHHVSEATQLLVHRLAEVARLRPTLEDMPLLEEIASSLNGLPLSIELAAATLRILTPKQLIQHLSPQVLDVGSTAYGSLGNSIRRSLTMLRPETRRTLHALALFRGSASLDALIYVLEAEAADVVGNLVILKDHSLITLERKEHTYQYGMLAAIRDAVVETMPPKEEAWLARQHVRYFSRLAEQALSRQRPDSEAMLRERNNMHLACERAVALRLHSEATNLALAFADPVLFVPYHQVTTSLSLALPLAKDISRAKLLLKRGTCRRFLGETSAALQDLEEAAELANAAGDVHCEADALCGVGNTITRAAEWERARPYFLRAMDLNPNPAFHADVMQMLANSYAGRDDHGPGIPLARKAVALADEHASTFSRARARLVLGAMLLEEGNLPEALSLELDALERFEALHNPHWEGVCLTVVARARQEFADHTAAMLTYQTAGERLKLAASPQPIALNDVYAASLYLEMHQPDAAMDRLRSALPIIREECPDNESFALGLYGVALAQLGGADADAWIERGLRLGKQYQRKSFNAFLNALNGEELEDSSLASTTLVALAKRLRRTLKRASDVQVLLLVDKEVSWFRLGAEGASVPIARRRAIRAVLYGLIEVHETTTGNTLSIEELMSLGWPGEKMSRAAGQERVYAVVATLRKLGLKTALEQHGEGYRLAPQVRIVRA